MKLRNKKTEEIVDVYHIYISKRVEDGTLTSHENMIRSFDSIAELNEKWEDYEPEAPKITNPEWCHVVRKWYELNCLEGELRVRVDAKNYVIIGWRKGEVENGQEIDIPLSVMECDEDYYRAKRYTIAELCGEEEG